ncbi:uroporphyrinogen-III synthase [Neobacillus rhizophilus]|uniref:Uroporphyrinogen-III synthase n=1 Tax=Neobacillus rhizophilus TaxID=2833579 RepID=A0A942YWX9_9BACI|nr:uroporphyrinogen-III synthase [Neobacillus rhizophilus]MBS4215457.1 uroporphyrinogen-III synthase [Neobacillus rhizophilus]MBU8916647.1 uroporphyrinogen-III synthase [Bacillus sp. FJAT-29953]
MSPSLPLLNKKVLVPRGEGQAKSFSELVERYGGIPIEIPLIAFRPIEKNQRLQESLMVLDTYDWIIFTSSVTVETFFSFVDRVGEGFPRVAVIGKKTEKVLRERGIRVDFVPSVYVAEEFVAEFLPYVKPGIRVLLPKGNLAREYIATGLRKAGAVVDELIIYENYMPEESREKLAKMLSERELEILTFTSPSTVDHLMDVVGEYGLTDHLNECIIACIGPVTEKRLLEYGLPIHASPEEYTVDEMVKSVIDFLEKING